eukprot:1156058-Pleurochrysis_carterae.AAC.2
MEPSCRGDTRGRGETGSDQPGPLASRSVESRYVSGYAAPFWCADLAWSVGDVQDNSRIAALTKLAWHELPESSEFSSETSIGTLCVSSAAQRDGCADGRVELVASSKVAGDSCASALPTTAAWSNRTVGIEAACTVGTFASGDVNEGVRGERNFDPNFTFEPGLPLPVRESLRRRTHLEGVERRGDGDGEAHLLPEGMSEWSMAMAAAAAAAAA